MEFYEKSKSCLKEANFELRKWATNSFEMKKFIDSNENNSRSKMDISESETYVENLFGSSSVYRKVLGLNWDTGADDFIFDFENICRTAEKLDVTKRNVLRIAAMFFDPLGLISPITLQPKLIFQELCRNKLEWDEVINDRNNIKKWTKFLHDLGQFRLINAPRHVLCCEGRDVELHGFSDSSGKAYGACVFVRVICEHGGSVRLWTSKCRLAPVKELSIPRLELMACLLLSRLMVSVKLAVEKEVSVKKYFLLDGFADCVVMDSADP